MSPKPDRIVVGTKVSGVLDNEPFERVVHSFSAHLWDNGTWHTRIQFKTERMGDGPNDYCDSMMLNRVQQFLDDGVLKIVEQPTP